MEFTLSNLIVIGLTAAIGATIVFGLFRLLDSLFSSTADAPDGNGIRFLIEGQELIDASPEAYSLLSHNNTTSFDKPAVIGVLVASFPRLEEVLGTDPVQNTIVESVDNSGKYLRIRTQGTAVSVSVQGPHAHDLLYLHQLKTANNTTELSTLRVAVENSNQLIWEVDAAGHLTWANSAYLNLTYRMSQHKGTGDLQVLPSIRPFAAFEDQSDNTDSGRFSISSAIPGEEDWFDVECVPTETGKVFYARDINEIVLFELSQKKFLKTMSQTFAQLSIGLAIFDRNRRLSTFNPALIDLTTLPVDFLSSRPSIDMLLDQLREIRMLPEPKDYTRWRDGFASLESEALNGTYSENWNLPDGQTYRVTGKPHPDGAFALLFEDISAEISLTRRFRSEIETGQSVLDHIPDAVAVFSSSGTLIMSNQSYEDLWEVEGQGCIMQSDLRSEINTWKTRSAPTRLWQSLRGYTQQTGPRDPWSETILLDDGRPIKCHADSISGGMTMIRFSLEPLLGQHRLHEIVQPQHEYREVQS